MQKNFVFFSICSFFCLYTGVTPVPATLRSKGAVAVGAVQRGERETGLPGYRETEAVAAVSATLRSKGAVAAGAVQRGERETGLPGYRETEAVAAVSATLRSKGAVAAGAVQRLSRKSKAVYAHGEGVSLPEGVEKGFALFAVPDGSETFLLEIA